MRLGFYTALTTLFSPGKVVINGESDYSTWYNRHEGPASQLIIVEAKMARHVTCDSWLALVTKVYG